MSDYPSHQPDGQLPKVAWFDPDSKTIVGHKPAPRFVRTGTWTDARGVVHHDPNYPSRPATEVFDRPGTVGSKPVTTDPA